MNITTSFATDLRYPFTMLVTVATLIVYFWITYKVGEARSRYQVSAPRMDGPEEFQRAYRVQANTVEQLILFIPLLWMTAVLAGDIVAAAIGMFWPFGRVLYALGYYKEARKRFKGFFINMLTYVLMLAVIITVFFYNYL